MTVAQLIDLLDDCDPEAIVLIGTQPSWPFEWDLAGLIPRNEIPDPDVIAPDTHPDDILLLTGEQLRYGSRLMWEHPRTP